jgi:spermidine synthase
LKDIVELRRSIRRQIGLGPRDAGDAILERLIGGELRDHRVSAVELLPEVIDASQIFAKSANAPQPAFPVRIVAADARRFILSSPKQYDVIVSDLFHPARSGAGSLYTVEHFSAVRKQLAPGGLFCQWLALHQMELDTLQGIIAAFQTVYPTGFAVLASNSLDTPVIGLIARPDAPQIRPDLVRKRLAQASSAEKAKQVKVN